MTKRKTWLTLLIVLCLLLAGCDDTPISLKTPTPTFFPTEVSTSAYTPEVSATNEPEPMETDTPAATITAIPLTPTNLPASPTETVPPTETPPLSPTATTVATTLTARPAPTMTPLPAPPDPTPTPVVSPSTPEPDEENRFINPGFEGEFYFEIVCSADGGECVGQWVAVGWNAFYCDEPYMPEKCPALEQGNGNPVGLVMRRPEFKTIYARDYPQRVHSVEQSQSWHNWAGAGRGGVYQTVPTTPGDVCHVSAYIQSWSNYDDDPESELTTEHDRKNSMWRIIVNLEGKTLYFLPDNLSSPSYGYSYGIYDKFVKIIFYFTANSHETTVFFEDLRLWPIFNNDSYIDDASIVCAPVE